MPKPVDPIPIPDTLLAVDGFADAWAEWLEYRKERRLTRSPICLKRQLRMLAEQPNPVAVLDQSITQGWQGLFPVKGQAKPTGDETPSELLRKQGVFKTRSMTDEERQLVFGV